VGLCCIRNVCKYRKYKLPSRIFSSVRLFTRIQYSETRRFQQRDNNTNFATLTFAMVAAANELFRLTDILQLNMVRNIAKVC